MANRNLFEALTGYTKPATAGDDGPQILSAGTAAADAETGTEPSEEEFADILEELDRHADNDPQFVQKLAEAFGIEPDRDHIKRELQKSKALVAEARNSGLLGPGGSEWSLPDTVLEGGASVSAAAAGPALLGIAPDFGDSYVEEHIVERYRRDLPRIDLEPKLRRFEDDNTIGILGWFVFNGLGAIKVPRSMTSPFAEQFGRISGAETFRRHTATDNFVHSLSRREGADRIRVALFADFGTGLAHSRFIARQIAMNEPLFDAAVHLGDVYYTGSSKQYREFFEDPLQPALDAGVQLFAIPDNHDGYEGFHAFVDYVDRKLKQKGSYFAIETEHVQFIGVDTIWHSDRGRITDEGLREWLRARFAAGRAAGRTNVLLTGHEPHEYRKPDLTRLNSDVLEVSNGTLDLWFWGNTHYCALFDRAALTPYYGSCIGHAGYPYSRQPSKETAEPSAAPVLFAEAGSRYEGSEVRPDRGMNGFCAFEIAADGSIELHYRDWRGHERCVVKFARQADGALQLNGVEDLTAS